MILKLGLKIKYLYGSLVFCIDSAIFWLDLKIILLTIWKVIKKEGISQKGRAAMDKFDGDIE